MTDSLKTLPLSGSRSAKAAEAMADYYAPDEEDDFEKPPQPPTFDEEENAVVPAATIPVAQAPVSAPSHPFRQIVGKQAHVIKIRVNGVGITMPVIEYHVSARSVCCILREEGWDCDLPITDDVVIELAGKNLRATYLGGFHRFSSLGVQIIYFPLPKLDTPTRI